MVQGEPTFKNFFFQIHTYQIKVVYNFKYRVFRKANFNLNGKDLKIFWGNPVVTKFLHGFGNAFCFFLTNFFLTGKSGDFQDKWVIYMLFHSATTSLFSIKKCNFIVENPLRFLSTMAQSLCS